MPFWKCYIETYISSTFPFKYFKQAIVNAYVLVAVLIGIVGFIADLLSKNNIFTLVFSVLFLSFFVFGVLIICSMPFSKMVLRESANFEDAKYGVYFLIYIGISGIALIFSEHILALFWGL